MTDLNEISRALQAGKAKQVKLLVQQAIDDGLDAQSILEQGLRYQNEALLRLNLTSSIPYLSLSHPHPAGRAGFTVCPPCCFT